MVTKVSAAVIDGITASGTTEPRTLADRFADVVNVKDFGAAGDGVTDDTVALTAFFEFLNTSGTNRKGIIPDGTYMTDTINIDCVTNITVECFGQATIKGTSGEGWILFFDCLSTALHAYTFDWQGGVIDASLRAHIAAQATGEALRVRGFKRAHVNAAIFQAGADYDVQVGDSGIVTMDNKHMRITGCQFRGMPDEGVYSKGTDDLIVEGCLFYRCWDGIRQSYGGRRFILTGNSFLECRTGTLASVRSVAGGDTGRVVNITGNIFYKCRSRSIDIREVEEGDIIANNRFIDWGYDLEGVRSVDDKDWPALAIYASKGVLVFGNTFSFTDYAADADHVCVRTSHYDPDGGTNYLTSTKNKFFNNVIRSNNGTIGTGFKEPAGATYGLYMWNDVENTTTPYSLDNSSIVYRQGLAYGGFDFIRDAVSTDQMVRIATDITGNYIEGRSVSGSSKTFFVRADSESSGLRLDSLAGNTDLDSAVGTVRVGRNSSANLVVQVPSSATVRHQLATGARLCLDDVGNVQAGGDSTGGAWDTGHLQLGPYHLWVDSTGDLRIKNGVPVSDTDGAVVGTQT